MLRKQADVALSGVVLIDMVVLGQKLDAIIFEVFSSLNDSMILVDPQPKVLLPSAALNLLSA